MVTNRHPVQEPDNDDARFDQAIADCEARERAEYPMWAYGF